MQNDSSFEFVAQPHPLRSDLVTGTLPEGSTLKDMGVGGCVVAFIDGERVDDLDYQPRAGEVVVIKVVAAGGGGQGDKAAMRFAAAIAITVASYGYAGPAAATAFSGGAGSTLWGAGIALVGNLALNAIVPMPSASLDTSAGAFEPFRRISNSNQVTPFGAIPRIYGTHRIYPPLAAYPYTEQAGSDRYVRMLFCLGYGPLTIDPASFKLGDTLLSEYEAEYEIREGTPGDQPVTLYNRNVFELALNDELSADGTSVVRTSATNARELSLDFLAPQGLVTVNSKGTKQGISTAVKIEFKKSTDSTWTVATPAVAHWSGDGGYSAYWPEGSANSGGLGFNGEWQVHEGDKRPAWYMRGAEQKAYTFNVRIPVDPGTYDVRVTRLGAFRFAKDEFYALPISEPNAAVTEIAWITLRTFGNDTAQTLPAGMAFIAMRIKATDQLAGSVNNFSCVATSRLPVYDVDTDSWIEQETSNPAWIYRDVLVGTANGRPLADGWESVAVRRTPVDPSVRRTRENIGGQSR